MKPMTKKRQHSCPVERLNTIVDDILESQPKQQRHLDQRVLHRALGLHSQVIVDYFDACAAADRCIHQQRQLQSINSEIYEYQQFLSKHVPTAQHYLQDIRQLYELLSDSRWQFGHLPLLDIQQELQAFEAQARHLENQETMVYPHLPQIMDVTDPEPQMRLLKMIEAHKQTLAALNQFLDSTKKETLRLKEHYNRLLMEKKQLHDSCMVLKRYLTQLQDEHALMTRLYQQEFKKRDPQTRSWSQRPKSDLRQKCQLIIDNYILPGQQPPKIVFCTLVHSNPAVALVLFAKHMNAAMVGCGKRNLSKFKRLMSVSTSQYLLTQFTFCMESQKSRRSPESLQRSEPMSQMPESATQVSQQQQSKSQSLRSEKGSKQEQQVQPPKQCRKIDIASAALEWTLSKNFTPENDVLYVAHVKSPSGTNDERLDMSWTPIGDATIQSELIDICESYVSKHCQRSKEPPRVVFCTISSTTAHDALVRFIGMVDADIVTCGKRSISKLQQMVTRSTSQYLVQNCKSKGSSS
ncbi:hypothetical protein EDD86DRAFT_244486 [Gorgonomyces haynaldii]|nr:hypothetical protein EDD86DRAFT_244486 [Gorgonomyces haynaldii]